MPVLNIGLRFINRILFKNRKDLRPGVFVRDLHRTLNDRINGFRGGVKLPSNQNGKIAEILIQ